MIRRFFSDERGNYALMTAVAIVPIMGGLALAVDYTEMSRQRQETLNALDAAGIATARRIVEGVTDDEAKAYAKSFFEANLGSVEPANTTLTVAAAAEQHRRRHAEAHGGAQVQALLLPDLRRTDRQGSGTDRRRTSPRRPKYG